MPSFEAPNKEMSGRPEIVSQDPDVVRIYCPRSSQYLTIQAWLPDMAAQDAFLESRQTLDDFFREGGRFIFLTGEHAEPNGPQDIRRQDTQDVDFAEEAERAKVTEEELIQAALLTVKTLFMPAD